ncbi:hypothetical protein RBB77_00995 [Tunturibacter psychrotolerans]|uniref:WD40 repeat protein n=1 Tax=Tunturiibacter psychrotolerans TaxID=3069686 RepID=A0AAU7ZRD4_9BACT
MSKVRSRVHVAGLFCFFASYLQPCANAIVEPTPAKDSALPVPEVFAPGIISGPANDGSPTFSPDGGTLFFTRSSAHWSIILESHRLRDGWSEPKVASFSGEWSDSSPALSPDGSFLVFVSVRPLATVSVQAKQGSPNMASHIWRVNRVGSGWNAPVELPESVNSFQWIFRPSVAGDGSIYFTAAVKGKELSLFRSKYQNGAYQNAEPLSFSDGSVKDVDPEIAPDQSFLVFTSKRPRPGDTSHEHLFIVYNRVGVWGSVVPIRYAGDDANGSSEDNDPRFGADHRTVYFTSDRTLAVHFPRTHEEAAEDYQRLQTWDNSNSNIWVISLSPVLKEATSSQPKL